MEDSNKDDKLLYIELLNKIADRVDETKDCISKLDKKLDLNIQEVNTEIKLINKQDEYQNEQLNTYNDILDIHIKRTEAAETRIMFLEEERRFISKLKNLVLTVGAIAGAIYTVLSLAGVV